MTKRESVDSTESGTSQRSDYAPRYNLQNQERIFLLLGQSNIDNLFIQLENENIIEYQVKNIAKEMKSGIIFTFNQESLTQIPVYKEYLRIMIKSFLFSE